MIVIAHRGACKEALENSWEAFELAIDAGATRIELDVRLTKDLAPVIMHDDCLKRTAYSSQKLSESLLDELTDVKLNNGEPIATLEQTLDKFLDRIEFNIELKGNDTLLAEKASEVVKKFANQKDKIIFSSFDDKPLCYLRDYMPEYKRAYLWGDIWKGIKKPFLKDPFKMLKHYDTQIFHPQAQLVTASLMQKAKEANLIVYPWTSLMGTENDPLKRTELWDHLREVGIHGLCTNYPREFHQWLNP